MAEDFRGSVCGGRGRWINNHDIGGSLCWNTADIVGSSDESDHSSVLMDSNLQMMMASDHWLINGLDSSQVDNNNHQDFTLDEERLSSYGFSSRMMQTSFEPQQSLFNHPTIIFPAATTSTTTSYKPEFNHQPTSLHFSNDTPYWNNASSTQAQFSTFKKKHAQSITTKVNEGVEESMKRGSELPRLKRARIETPSPLPTFKVRKEKLGDRITALQQLVSPFGKTDTASVLHEASEYIKFLHDQLSVLTTPYMKNDHPNSHRKQSCKKFELEEASAQDLKTRGLCLVPISSTFPVSNEMTSEFWTPTFGATFR